MDLPPPVPDVPAAFTATVLAAFAARPGPRFTLALSGGPTARLCYERLARQSAALDPDIDWDINWSLVDIYMGDERQVPPTDTDANQQLVREALTDPLADAGTPPGSFTPMRTDLPVAQCIADYQRTIATLLEGPGLDLIHLGLGPDGHTASLFPGSPTLDAPPSELVAATTDPNERNPHARLTLTLPAINRARHAVFTVTGSAKADAIAALRRGDDLPAARIAAAQVTWLIDDAAATPSP